MAGTKARNTSARRLAGAWSRCVRTRALNEYCHLGREFQAALDTLGYGEKDDLLTDVLGVVQKAHPHCRRHHLQNTLYRTARFARCCGEDPKLLPRLERAGLRWWAVCDIMSILVRRLDASRRDQQAISKTLNQGLLAAARRTCTPGELVAELKEWRRSHPSHFRGRWNNASVRTAHGRALRALDDAEAAWAVLRKQVGPELAAATKRFRQAVAKARVELG